MTKRALIVELNPYHGEILPGFVNYFQQTGYATDVWMRTESYKENPFVRFPKAKMPAIVHGSLGSITEKIKRAETEKYDIVLFSTNVLWEAGVNYSSVFQYLGFIPKAKIGTLYIEHNLSCIDMDDSSALLSSGRIATILPYHYKEGVTPMINPHYYGELDRRSVPNALKRILVVGASSKERYTTDILVYATRQFVDEDFEIVVVGGDGHRIPQDLKDKIKTTGRLSFTDYYNEIEKSDFILTLYNSDNPRLDRYLNGTTSGTVQISLGFSVPMIIDRSHADKYGFSENESIIFSFNDLSKGLEKALMMSDDEYAAMCVNLKTKSKDITNESVKNLTFMLGVLERPRGEMVVRTIDESTLALINKKKEIELLESKIAGLKLNVHERNNQLTQTKEILEQQLKEIHQLLNSREHIRATKLYKKIKHLIPEGSRRENLLRKSLRVYRRARQGMGL